MRCIRISDDERERKGDKPEDDKNIGNMVHFVVLDVFEFFVRRRHE